MKAQEVGIGEWKKMVSEERAGLVAGSRSAVDERV